MAAESYESGCAAASTVALISLIAAAPFSLVGEGITALAALSSVATLVVLLRDRRGAYRYRVSAFVSAPLVVALATAASLCAPMGTTTYWRMSDDLFAPLALSWMTLPAMLGLGGVALRISNLALARSLAPALVAAVIAIGIGAARSGTAPWRTLGAHPVVATVTLARRPVVVPLSERDALRVSTLAMCVLPRGDIVDDGAECPTAVGVSLHAKHRPDASAVSVRAAPGNWVVSRDPLPTDERPEIRLRSLTTFDMATREERSLFPWQLGSRPAAPRNFLVVALLGLAMGAISAAVLAKGQRSGCREHTVATVWLPASPADARARWESALAGDIAACMLAALVAASPAAVAAVLGYAVAW